ncbi:hypothetical protein [Vulcanisaeta distributa]|uniref:Uncharacterized protein n=1 Tax=Vulcanisaeta distributa (strain DSM 14429 / JCM 11212 / NBRC 100878 / IC-017) TaxID=572478 RepID=E1QSD5_VULDI|nr:hypothetical protein [Vulcanisaeta distributa]ADN49528.1 hypothetical protein Vdis_0115 [Vulcanisaeta distributa DSM 14429]
MPTWLYHLDEFRLVSDYDFNYTINELIGIALSKAEELSIKPTTVCHLELNNLSVCRALRFTG